MHIAKHTVQQSSLLIELLRATDCTRQNQLPGNPGAFHPWRVKQSCPLPFLPNHSLLSTAIFFCLTFSSDCNNIEVFVLSFFFDSVGEDIVNTCFIPSLNLMYLVVCNHIIPSSCCVDTDNYGFTEYFHPIRKTAVHVNSLQSKFNTTL